MKRRGERKGLLVRDKSFYKALFLIALPIVMQNIITIGVNIMDTVMLGSFGEIQISASSLANNFFEVFHILNMGIGGGAGVLIAQYWGARDIKSVKKVITIMFRICLLGAILFTLTAAFLPAQIMSIYTNDASVIDKGALYMLISLPTFFLQGMTLVMTLSLRAMRKVTVPFVASCVSFFVNIFFNWVFIFGKLGAPRMEIAGAALGTVTARVVEMLVIAVYYFRMEKDVAMRLSDLLKPCGDQLGLFGKYGIPVIVSDLLLTLGNNAVAVIMGHVGTLFVAAHSIVAPMMRLSTVMTMGLGQAAATVTGNIVGTGDRDAAQRCGVTCLVLSVITGLVSSVIMLILCPITIGFYRITPETVSIAYEMMYAFVAVLVFQAVQAVLTKGVLRGGGDTRFVMVADALFMWILSIPLGALCGLVWNCGPFLIYFSLKLDFIVKSVWCSERLLSGKWIKKITV